MDAKEYKVESEPIGSLRDSTVGRLLDNRISALGAFLAVLMAILIVISFGLDFFTDLHSPYGGIYIYVVLMPMLVLGFILIPLGKYRKWRMLQKYGELPYQRWLSVDLNKRSHRTVAFVFIIGTIFFIVISALVSYEAYRFTESVEFCGTICHEVMHPEHTAYQGSPHARVPCTLCHVGEGASYYTKSKLSGAYQVYAVTLNKYPKPLPTPIENLRPAQETCEKCHWPEHFYGAQQRRFNRYFYDEGNTQWPINLLIKTGGGDPKTGQTSGIHWHMNIGVKVEYIARDHERLDIPWTRITDHETGRVTVYQEVNDPLTEEEIAKAKPRVMDCIDCHNRPSHIFNSPDFILDKTLLLGQVDQSIPYIKRVGVEALALEYETPEKALEGIANYITDYYRTKMMDTYKKKQVAIDESIVALQTEYSKNIFPDMKVRWPEYFTNIGHMESPGCFRCHDGNHKSDAGIVITNDCKTCHIILSQGSGENPEVSKSPDGLDFVHPKPIGESWKKIGCFNCHKGTMPG